MKLLKRLFIIVSLSLFCIALPASASCPPYTDFKLANFNKDKTLDFSIRHLMGSGISLYENKFHVNTVTDSECEYPFCMNGQFEILEAGERVCVVSYVAFLDYNCEAMPEAPKPTLEVVRSVGHPKYKCYNSTDYSFVVVK